MSTHVFVVGLDDMNLRLLNGLPELRDYRFHQVLSRPELRRVEGTSIAALLDKAHRMLEPFPGRIDAILSWWDFPATSLVPLLSQRFQLPAPPLEAVLKCEDKYWSRLEQRKVISELPRFGIVELEGTPQPPPGMAYPLWLKPVKSYSSVLAFKVHDRTEFDTAVTEIKRGGLRIGRPFDEVLALVDAPAEVTEVGGEGCLAEETMRGTQLTVEGFRTDERIEVYGIVDTVPYPGMSSFLRYQYPSRAPESVRNRLTELSRTVVRQLGLRHSAFNIEYFWDPETDQIKLLEVNPRVSQSHARLFHFVDGEPNLLCPLRLALGQTPDLTYRRGRYNVAAKWFLRQFRDGVVRRVPTPAEVERIERDTDSVIRVLARVGWRLSGLPVQDSYSFAIAELHLGADDERQLVEKHEECVRRLPFVIEP